MIYMFPYPICPIEPIHISQLSPLVFDQIAHFAGRNSDIQARVL